MTSGKVSDVIGECWEAQFYEKQKKQLEFVRKYYEQEPKETPGEGNPKRSKTESTVTENRTGMVRLVLKSGNSLPEEFENEHPIITETAGETIVYWFKRTGLKRIK